MAIRIDRRSDEAADVQKMLTRHGCIISLRIGLHEIGNVCAEDGLVLLNVCGKEKEVAALKKDLRAIKGVHVKSMEV
jgi:hypothetical protein